jgi:ribose/xylose/arabinose/galactoside ABC-type transport system permease subunit
MGTSTIVQYVSSLRKPSIPLAVPILLVYLAAGVFLVPEFLSISNITSILFSAAVLLPAVAGTQLLLVLGRFDLSIGATASLSGMIAGLALGFYGSLTVAVCSGLIVGVVVGWACGSLVSYLRVDPLVATLAVMGIVRSLSLVVNSGQIVSGLPESFGWITEARLTGIPVLILFVILFTGIATVVTKHAVLFRRFYAVGNNAIAASHAGVNVTRLVTLGYILAGLGAALTGLIQVSRTRSASPLIFDTLALEAIAACMIGGSSLSGGRGNILGASIGLIVLIATRNLVVMLGVTIFWKDFTTGILLLLAVVGRPLVEALRKRFSKQR